MKVGIMIEQRGGMSKRNHNRCANAAFRGTMEHHVTERFKRHFEDNADTAPGGAYRYEPRKQSYNDWKRKRFGHATPLVRFGNLRRKMLSQGKTAVMATFKGARARLRGTFKMRTKLRAEIEVITAPERKAMAKELQERYLAEVIKYPTTEKRHIT